MGWESTNSSDEFARLSLSFALISLIISCWAWLFIKNRAGRPPGPRGLPLLGYLPFLDAELHSHLADLARAYGPILQLRLGSKVGIVVTSPSLAREVLKDQDTNFANRDVPDFVRALDYGGHDILFTSYGPEWRMLRRVCARAMLSSGTLDVAYDLRRREFQRTVSYIYSQTGSPINVGEQMFLTVMNVITNMLWGGTVKGDERASLGAEFRRVVTEMTELMGKPNTSDFFPALAWFDLQGIRKGFGECAMTFDAIFNSVIQQRIKIDREGGNGGGKDFLQFLLKLKDEGDSKTPLSMGHVKALLLVIFSCN